MRVLPTPSHLSPFVKDILLFSEQEKNTLHHFPFYADGFPGVIYTKSKHPFYLQPTNKKLSNFYLYGQTVEPISLEILGQFEMIILRLYPFAANILLDVDPKVLVDDCYDLTKIENIDTLSMVASLDQTENPDTVINILATYFDKLVKSVSHHPNKRIKLATNIIVKSKGKISIKELRSRLNVGERTFERHFNKEIGVTPKQFAKIIQFSTSLNQIKDEDYLRLSDVGFDSGFADQSHFIRTFKHFTGKTPKEFQKQVFA